MRGRSAQSEKKKMTAEIKKGINENKNTFELRDVIIGFKKKGGSQKEAHEILEKISKASAQESQKK